MNIALFIKVLRELPLQEAYASMQDQAEELFNHTIIGEMFAEEALRLLYDPAASLKVAELLIFFGEFFHHLPSHALGLKAKGDALMRIEHHRAALECLDAAGKEFLAIDDEWNWARSRISWIYSAAALGRIEDALQEAARARGTFLKLGESYWVCVIDNNTAIIYKNIGRYQDALKLYENMLALYPIVTDQGETFIVRSIAIAQVNQARLLTWLGEFERAYVLLQQAQKSFAALGEADLTTEVEINLADLDFSQGFYGSALRRYYRARESIEENDDNNALLLAELKLSMSGCLVKLNRVQEARFLSGESVKTYREYGLLLSTGNSLREHATTLAACGRLQEALDALDEAWSLFHRGGFDPFAALARIQQTELLLEMGSNTAAYEQARLLKSYCDAQGLIALSIRTSLVMGGALLANARRAISNHEKEQQTLFLREAIRLSRLSNMQARQHGLQEEVYKGHYLLGRTFAFQANHTQAAKQYRAAIAQIEHILDNLAHDLSPSFLHTTWMVYQDMVALCLEQSQVDLAFSYLERARSLGLRQYLSKFKTLFQEAQKGVHSAEALRTQYELRNWQEKHRSYSVLLSTIEGSASPALDREIIRDELKRCEVKLSEAFERLQLYQSGIYQEAHPSSPRKRANSTRSVFKATDIDLALLRHHLAPDHLLLAYYIHGEKLVVFAVTAERIVTHENPSGAIQLEHLLLLLQAHLQPGGWSNPLQPPQQIIRRLLNKLYSLLMAPIASLLPPESGYLTIVPYGPLHNVPFHALYDGSRYLIENVHVNYLPASSLLARLGTSENEQHVPSTTSAVPVRRPLVFGYSENGYLPYAHDEAKAIASMLVGNCYLEYDATIARLIDEAPGSPIIHLATHGQSRLDRPDFSYVRLSDGQLNAIDAFSLDLSGCELVTLSGCETGLALSGGGDEQLGLGRAFLAAGATSLVMSLWSVEDNATNELMQNFYQHLLEGQSKVQALRAAQCSMLHRDGSITSHPYFWAGFHLVGNDGPLKYRGRNGITPYLQLTS